MLLALRDYLQHHGRAAVKDIAHALGQDEAMVRHALQQWVAKGKARRLATGTPCRGCRLCPPDEIELYEWIEDGHGSGDDPPLRAAAPATR